MESRSRLHRIIAIQSISYRNWEMTLFAVVRGLPWFCLLRALQVVLVVSTIAVTALGIRDGSLTTKPANFTIFCTIWTTVALVYIVLIPLLFLRLVNRALNFALESLTAAFWCISFTCLVADIRVTPSEGEDDTCSLAKGSAALSFLNLFAWAATFALFAAKVAFLPKRMRHSPSNTAQDQDCTENADTSKSNKPPVKSTSDAGGTNGKDKAMMPIARRFMSGKRSSWIEQQRLPDPTISTASV